jgi:hypothetical protein
MTALQYIWMLKHCLLATLQVDACEWDCLVEAEYLAGSWMPLNWVVV